MMSSAIAVSADFSGEWKGNLAVDSDQVPGYLVLQQKGPDVTGTAGATVDHQIAIETGHVEGDEMTIVARPGALLKFKLRLIEDKLTGDVFEDDQKIGTANFERVAE